jgi:hypothetical protein
MSSLFDPGATGLLSLFNPSLQCSGPDSAEEPSVHSREGQLKTRFPRFLHFGNGAWCRSAKYGLRRGSRRRLRCQR